MSRGKAGGMCVAGKGTRYGAYVCVGQVVCYIPPVGRTTGNRTQVRHPPPKGPLCEGYPVVG